MLVRGGRFVVKIRPFGCFDVLDVTLLGQVVQIVIHRCKHNAGVFFLRQAKDLVGGQVPLGIPSDLQDGGTFCGHVVLPSSVSLI